jgi:hypothetical protein
MERLGWVEEVLSLDIAELAPLVAAERVALRSRISARSSRMVVSMARLSSRSGLSKILAAGCRNIARAVRALVAKRCHAASTGVAPGGGTRREQRRSMKGDPLDIARQRGPKAGAGDRAPANLIWLSLMFRDDSLV